MMIIMTMMNLHNTMLEYSAIGDGVLAHITPHTSVYVDSTSVRSMLESRVVPGQQLDITFPRDFLVIF